MKRKTIRKIVNDSIAWSEFRIEGIKGRENFIELIVHVN